MTTNTVSRELWDNWVVIENYKRFPSIFRSVSDFEGEHLLGYCYIDHTVGITCDVLALFVTENSKFVVTTNLIDKKVRVLLRHETFAGEEYRVENETFMTKLGISKPDYYSIYAKNNLTDFRNSEQFDEFRANGFPDDIQIYLLPKNGSGKTEIVWGRVEDYDNQKQMGLATLLVKTYQDFGIRQNETFVFQLVKFENKFYPIGLLK